MRALIIHNGGRSSLPSGERAVVDSEADALRRAGVDVACHIVSNDDVGSSMSLGTVAAGVNIFWSRRSFRETKELLKRHKPDVVHFHSVFPLLTASAFYACDSERVPCVQTLHNYRWFCVEGGLYNKQAYCEDCFRRGPARGVVNRCSRNSAIVSGLLTINNHIYAKSGRLFKIIDHFIAVSNFVKEKHVQAGFPDRKVTVKYNGIDLARAWGRPVDSASRKAVTFVGRLTPAKGTSILKEIARRMPDVRINIVGDGPDFEELRQACQSSPHQNVSLFGKQPPERVRELMSESACVVVPSVFPEPLGLVAIEAMACGAPVVASRIGGLAEIVEQSGGGVTVGLEGKAEGFISAIRAVVSSPERVAELGARGRGFVERNLSMDNSVKQLLSIYERVIEERGQANGQTAN
ncbi:MAG TPA: glycosyltransferase family 4 protein [Blastocatellia bacterium]|nr:glycosyltransferase family 4 protein [Blastocatellia bacterium]